MTTTTPNTFARKKSSRAKSARASGRGRAGERGTHQREKARSRFPWASATRSWAATRPGRVAGTRRGAIKTKQKRCTTIAPLFSKFAQIDSLSFFFLFLPPPNPVFSAHQPIRCVCSGYLPILLGHEMRIIMDESWTY